MRNLKIEKLIEKYKDCLYLNESENYSNGEIYEEIKEIKKIKNMKETTILDLKKILPYFSDNIAKNDRNSSNINLEKEFKRKKGLAMHYYFEHILNDLENDKIVAKSALYSRYGNMLGKKIVEDLIERLDKFISKNLEMYSSKYKVYTEFEILNADGEKRIIDRINIDEKNKKIYIYDYKTGFEPETNEKYQEQINEYKEILKNKIYGYEIVAKLLEV